jgi:hypothetical protein
MVYALIITCGVLSQLASLSEYYSYVATFPVYSLLFCLIRNYVLWTPKVLPPAKEEEAIETAMILLDLACSKGLLLFFARNKKK